MHSHCHSNFLDFGSFVERKATKILYQTKEETSVYLVDTWGRPGLDHPENM